MVFIKSILIVLIIFAILVTYSYIDTIGNQAWEIFEFPKAVFLYYTGISLITLWGFLLGITGCYGLRFGKKMFIFQAIIVFILILIPFWVQILGISINSQFLFNFFTNQSIKLLMFVWLGIIVGAIFTKFFINNETKK